MECTAARPLLFSLIRLNPVLGNTGGVQGVRLGRLATATPERVVRSADQRSEVGVWSGAKNLETCFQYIVLPKKFFFCLTQNTHKLGQIGVLVWGIFLRLTCKGGNIERQYG